jgi:6-phosphofructokinase
MPAGTLLYAQSGGVTAVINATASAVIQAGRARKVRVLAARNGILGALREDLVDASALPRAQVRALAHTPGVRQLPAEAGLAGGGPRALRAPAGGLPRPRRALVPL